MTSLKQKIKSLPKKPGVYIYKNTEGKIIYIGKALSLKDRVASYFRQKHQDAKTNELVEKIADLQTIQVNSEFEALLLEAKLIKQHKPKYNIQTKDGKSYLYIIISKDYPNRIYTARRPEIEENILVWFGPFPSSRDAKEILKTIRPIFPFRSCTNLPKRPCLYYHLCLCPGICQMSLRPADSAGKQSQTSNNNPTGLPRGKAPRNDIEIDYQNTIVRIKQMLSGKTSALIRELEKEMKSSAKALDFEKAREVKYKIDALFRFTQGWKNVSQEKQEVSKTIEEIKKILIKYGGINQLAINKIEGYDVSNLSSEIIVGSMVAFVNNEPEKSSYRKFNLKGHFNFQTKKTYEHQDDPEGIKQILSRRLNHPEWILPQLILIDGGKTQISSAFLALKEKSLENQIALIGLTKEKEILIIPQIKLRSIIAWKRFRLPRNSEVLQLFQRLRDESHRFAQKYYKNLHQKISI